MRIHQWLKNLFIVAPLFFAGQAIASSAEIVVLFQGILAFCLLSSGVYIINDYCDRAQDQLHPEKRKRPLASGAISIRSGLSLAAGLILVALILSIPLGWTALQLIILYLGINVLYSFYLKNFPIADILIIAFGFLIRIAFGAAILQIPLSHWILLMVGLLALILALGKRRGELLNTKNADSRKVLRHYNVEFVNVAIIILTPVLIFTYILYATSPEILQRVGANTYTTAVFVIVGLLRYLQQTFVYNKSEFPTRLLLEDRILQGILLLWIASFAYLIYG